MSYQTIIVSHVQHGLAVTFNRLQNRNAINRTFIDELNAVINEAEKDPDIRVVILKGQQGIFCTGMDFREAISGNTSNIDEAVAWSANYMQLIKRFTLTPKIIIAVADGQVMAGGMGIYAASDITVATTKSQFALSEALWGLLPANVLPYLIRRIGFQKAYHLTLTTKTITGPEAHAIHLVDELSDNPDEVLQKQLLRLARLDERTIADLKAYFRKQWIVDEKKEEIAIMELARLIQEPRVQNNIKRYVEEGKFPWEKD